MKSMKKKSYFIGLYPPQINPGVTEDFFAYVKSTEFRNLTGKPLSESGAHDVYVRISYGHKHIYRRLQGYNMAEGDMVLLTYRSMSELGISNLVNPKNVYVKPVPKYMYDLMIMSNVEKVTTIIAVLGFIITIYNLIQTQ